LNLHFKNNIKKYESKEIDVKINFCDEQGWLNGLRGLKQI